MRRTTTTAAVVAGLLVTTLSAPATAGARGPDVSRVPTPDISWGACADDAPAGFECATVELPTDYDRPRGATTTIGLTRLPASDPADRRGSLFLNFGGPGGPGVASLQALSDKVVSPGVRRHYDLVGVDPRGVGTSDPASCYASPEQEQQALADLAPFPVGPKETVDFLKGTRELAQSCRARSADRIRHSSTANVARDFEVLRRAVGDDRLNYLGYSYGTVLGATYAKLFPQRVGRFVLDGTLDPVKWSGSDGDPRSLGARIGQGPAAAEVFDQFLRTCRTAGERCALNALGDPRTVTDELWASLKRRPVTLTVDGEPVEVTYATAASTAFQSLYSPATFGDLADFLASASRATRPSTRSAPPRVSLPRVEEYSGVGDALGSACVDSPSRLPASGYAPLAAREERKAPVFGAQRAWIGIQCRFMGLRDDDAYRGPWRQTTRSTVMVIGTRHDPATPYAFTKPYAQRFPSAGTLTVEGYGHTTMGVSTCAEAAVERYLLRGTAPKPGATCEQSVRPFTTASSDAPRTERVPGVAGLG